MVSRLLGNIQQLERVQCRAAHLVKKDYRYTTSVTGMLDELGWLPLFERHKHSRLMVFHKALNNLSAFSPDHFSVSSRHTTASNENKFLSLPVRTDVFKYSLFLGPLLTGLPENRNQPESTAINRNQPLNLRNQLPENRNQPPYNNTNN